MSALRCRGMAIEPTHNVAKSAQVYFHNFRDAGPLHLHRNSLTRGQPCTMYLTKGSRCYRLPRKLGKSVISDPPRLTSTSC
jgi:hypothetical protein